MGDVHFADRQASTDQVRNHMDILVLGADASQRRTG
jgi:hypothetical protein